MNELLIGFCALALLVAVLLVFLAHGISDAAERTRARAAEDLRRSVELAHAAMRHGPDKDLVELIKVLADQNHDLAKDALEAAMSISDDFRGLKKLKLETALNDERLRDSRDRLLTTMPSQPPRVGPPKSPDEIVDEQPRGSI